MIGFLKLRWLFNRRIGLTILWGTGLLAVAALINIVGIQAAGDIQHWTLWLKNHAPLFLIWRLCLYGVVGYGWWWMRQRVIQRETTAELKTAISTQFMRIEVATLCALLVLETSLWFS